METEADRVLLRRAEEARAAQSKAEQRANAARLRQEAALRARIPQLIQPLLDLLEQREYRDMRLQEIRFEREPVFVAVLPLAQSRDPGSAVPAIMTDYYLRGDGSIITRDYTVDLDHLELGSLQTIAKGLEDSTRKLQKEVRRSKGWLRRG